MLSAQPYLSCLNTHTRARACSVHALCLGLALFHYARCQDLCSAHCRLVSRNLVLTQHNTASGGPLRSWASGYAWKILSGCGWRPLRGWHMGKLGGPPLCVQSSWWAWAQRDAMVEYLRGRDHSPNISRLASPPPPQGLEGARPAPLRHRPLVQAVCPPERQQQHAHGRCGVALRHQGQPP